MKKMFVSIISVIFPLVTHLPGFTEGIFWIVKTGEVKKVERFRPKDSNPAFDPAKVLKGYVLENVKKIKK